MRLAHMYEGRAKLLKPVQIRALNLNVLVGYATYLKTIRTITSVDIETGKIALEHEKKVLDSLGKFPSSDILWVEEGVPQGTRFDRELKEAFNIEDEFKNQQEIVTYIEKEIKKLEKMKDDVTRLLAICESVLRKKTTRKKK